MGWRTWREAMQDALYGPGGFYVASGAPARNFRTAAHASPLWAEAIAELCDRVDTALGCPDDFTVVDLGAGGGELIAGLARLAPERWQLVGVDLAARPDSVDDRVTWAARLPDGFTGVLLAVEWLDVVPVDVVERTGDGLRLVEVDDAGAERLAGQPPPDDGRWLDAWWPVAEPGDRAEIGSTRDDAWQAAVGRMDRGVAVAVDYAAVPARDVAGTLAGFRDGRQVPPVPDGSCDLTAHVLFDSCAAAVTDVECRRLNQRDALAALGVSAARPAYDGEPLAYLHALSRTGAAAELKDRGGLGAFEWLLHARGVAPPL
ncbi:MAG: SAM-dependent methyltransferase [Frankiales bacterium]|nr:SAM-dependent methyltransferase [Frankiales bacterium]